MSVKKWLSGIYSVSTSFLTLDPDKATLGHSRKLDKMAATKACRINYFFRPITNKWNSLSNNGHGLHPRYFQAVWTKHWNDTIMLIGIKKEIDMKYSQPLPKDAVWKK